MYSQHGWYVTLCWYKISIVCPIGLQLEADKFFIFLLTLFMVSVASAAITYAFSSAARVTAVATLLSALTFVLSMVSMRRKISLLDFPLTPAVVWWILHCPELTACVVELAQVPQPVPICARGSLY